MRGRWLCVVGVCAALTACGTSEEERVERALESYPRALAAGDAREACDSWAEPERRDEFGRRDFCERLERIAAEMTLAQRLRSWTAEAVRIDITGDRATAYLRFGSCIVPTSGSVLVRDDDGDWRIESIGGVSTNVDDKPCLE